MQQDWLVWRRPPPRQGGPRSKRMPQEGRATDATSVPPTIEDNLSVAANHKHHSKAHNLKYIKGRNRSCLFWPTFEVDRDMALRDIERTTEISLVRRL